MRSLFVLLLIGCGVEGPQGPQGVQGPPGMGGKSTFDVPTNSVGYLVDSRGVAPAPGPTHVFDLAALTTIPSTATALYLEVSGCIQPAGPANGIIEFKTATSQAIRLYVTRRCMTSTTELPRESEIAWFSSTAPRELTETAIEVDVARSAITGWVRVLGWYEP